MHPLCFTSAVMRGASCSSNRMRIWPKWVCSTMARPGSVKVGVTAAAAASSRAADCKLALAAGSAATACRASSSKSNSPPSMDKANLQPSKETFMSAAVGGGGKHPGLLVLLRHTCLELETPADLLINSFKAVKRPQRSYKSGAVWSRRAKSVGGLVKLGTEIYEGLHHDGRVGGAARCRGGEKTGTAAAQRAWGRAAGNE